MTIRCTNLSWVAQPSWQYGRQARVTQEAKQVVFDQATEARDKVAGREP